MSNFIRLNITSEGTTEHRFVKDVLYKHLQPFHIYCEVRSVLTSREYKKRGGLTTYQRAKDDIMQWMKKDSNNDARFTTMFDYYALPAEFPGLKESLAFANPYDRVKCIENAFASDMDNNRFIPYIQMFEFESLLFANLDVLLLEYESREMEIQQLKNQLEKPPFKNNPELINDKRDTSPSHRILKIIPEYQKVNSGSLIAGLISIEKLKQDCQHFNEWITKLENL